MFCLRSWLPLLFIPTNASPLFVITFFLLTYFLNRPCVYCSILLLILFVSSCYWSDQCFFDLNGNWFEPRHVSSPLAPGGLAPFSSSASNASQGDRRQDNSSDASNSSFLLAGAVTDTVVALGGAAIEGVRRRSAAPPEWTGIGIEWFRSWLGTREWRVPCVDVVVRL